MASGPLKETTENGVPTRGLAPQVGGGALFLLWSGEFRGERQDTMFNKNSLRTGVCYQKLGY